MLVRRPGRPSLLLVGDLTYDAHLLEHGHLPGVGSRRQLHTMTAMTNALRRRHPDLVILPAHDPGAAGRLATATGEQLDIDTLTAKGNRSHERTAGIAADSRAPEKVRRVLLDTLALPDWNPAFRAIDGPARAATAVGYPIIVHPGLTRHFEYAAIGPHRIDRVQRFSG
jgi:hypothetical protein